MFISFWPEIFEEWSATILITEVHLKFEMFYMSGVCTKQRGALSDSKMHQKFKQTEELQNIFITYSFDASGTNKSSYV